MQFELTINLDNAAFEDSSELPRILAELAERLRLGHRNMEADWNYHLRDVNGNSVGHFQVCSHHAFDAVEAE
jgi:hypothetical protein